MSNILKDLVQSYTSLFPTRMSKGVGVTFMPDRNDPMEAVLSVPLGERGTGWFSMEQWTVEFHVREGADGHPPLCSFRLCHSVRCPGRSEKHALPVLPDGAEWTAAKAMTGIREFAGPVRSAPHRLLDALYAINRPGIRLVDVDLAPGSIPGDMVERAEERIRWLVMAGASVKRRIAGRHGRRSAVLAYR